MTVAAVILSASPEGSLALADGVARVRRIADVAWAGGAIPIVVVAADPDGAVSDVLAGSEALLRPPADPAGGPVGQMAAGIATATATIRETDAVLLWPARLCWVDAETVTSLIEAHGADPDPVLRPAFAGEVGWPVLVPETHAAALAAVGPGLMPPDVIDALAATGVAVRAIEVGDPGVVLDAGTAREDLPAYGGPPAPTSGVYHEWGATAADRSDAGR
jgi:CTP:molybdopterin cytidylyltransferase MocA